MPTDYFLFARLEFRSYCANVINGSQLRGWRYLPLILRTACALIKTLRNYSRFKMQQCVISLRRRISVTHVLAWINSFLETETGFTRRKRACSLKDRIFSLLRRLRLRRKRTTNITLIEKCELKNHLKLYLFFILFLPSFLIPSLFILFAVIFISI